MVSIAKEAEFNMAKVTITHIDRGLPLGLPYIICIDGRPVGMMQMPQARMNLPAGMHRLKVQCGGYLPIPFTKKTLTLMVEAEDTFVCTDEQFTEIRFENRERWWNWVFNIDLILWFARLFLTIPEPWGLVYDIVSNVTFAAWLLHFYLYRKRYFKFKVVHTDEAPTTVLPTEIQRKVLEMMQKRMRNG